MNSIIRMLLCGVVAAGVLMGKASVANATGLWFHGSACKSSDPAVSVNQFGIFNTSAIAKVVTCEIPFTSQGTPPIETTFSFAAYDRSSTDDVSCTLSHLQADGSMFSGESSATVSTTGNSAGVQLVPNPNRFQAWTSGSHFWEFQCSIPGQTASGVSILTAVAFVY